jgi:hypothetical protein
MPKGFYEVAMVRAPVNRLANLRIARAGLVVVGRWHLLVGDATLRGWAVGRGGGAAVAMAVDPSSQSYWIADSATRVVAEDAPL